jgi:anion-transporting  ArsA/GET3 family ATPase
MEVASFCKQSRVIVVAGKGGVGKSTMVAALGKMAADAGLSVLIVELEGKPGISAAFGASDVLSYEESLLAPAADPEGRRSVRARRITPDDALLE